MGNEVRVQVVRLAAGGDGVARLPDGRVLFVPFTAPGDEVRVRISQSRRRFARGEVTELLAGGPDRVEPGCAVFGRCGGCSWQHLRYEAQVESKRTILRDALVRIGSLDPPAEIPFTPSPPYGYRMRTRLLVASGRIGLRRRRSHAICAIERCPVLVPSLEEKLADAGGPGGDGEWELTAGHAGVVRASLLSSREPGGLRRDGSARIDLNVAGERLGISPGVFLQANAFLIEPLVATVLAAAKLAGGEPRSQSAVVLELYAGAGLFTLALARAFDRTLAVESNPAALRDLRANLRSAGLRNVEVVGARVEQVLSRSQVAVRPEVIVLDPPRNGLGRAASVALSELGAGRVVYLSCDPATLARDLAVLCERGYALVHVEGFDLFPQTPHVEALAVLER